MITETTVEWYRFTCAHCSTWWIAHYEVLSCAIEDVTQSFYRYHGLPCEAPAHAMIICPGCHRTSVQAELLDHPAVDTAPQRPLATQPYGARVAGWTGRHFKFKALISLSPPVRHRPARPYPSGTQSLLVRTSSLSLSAPHLHMYFPAATFTATGQPLKPGDSNVIVTIMVPDHAASDFFGPGHHIELWNGREVGHGTVSARSSTGQNLPDPASNASNGHSSPAGTAAAGHRSTDLVHKDWRIRWTTAARSLVSR